MPDPDGAGTSPHEPVSAWTVTGNLVSIARQIRRFDSRKERVQTAMASTLLDATGLRCPIPVLKARKAVRSLVAGDTLEVLSTDPGSVPDFEAFCDAGGHELLEQSEDGKVFRFLIRISG